MSGLVLLAVVALLWPCYATVGAFVSTLYHHVGSKEEMLDALIDMVTDEFAYAPAGTNWKDAIRTVALSAYSSLSRHRWAANLSLSLRRPSPGRLRYMDSILGILRDAGFSDDLVDRGYHAIEGHIMGFTLWEVGMNLPAREDVEPMAANFLRELDHEAYPHVADHVGHHLRQAGRRRSGLLSLAWNWSWTGSTGSDNERLTARPVPRELTKKPHD